MKRIIAVVVVLGVTLGGVALAGGNDTRKRTPSDRANPQALPGVEASREEARAALRASLRDQITRVAWTGACSGWRCVNRRLNTLKSAVNGVRADFNALNACLLIQGMSSYGEDPNGGTYGYVWRDDDLVDEFLTTGLDFDDTDTPHVWTVVWGC